MNASEAVKPYWIVTEGDSGTNRLELLIDTNPLRVRSYRSQQRKPFRIQLGGQNAVICQVPARAGHVADKSRCNEIAAEAKDERDLSRSSETEDD